MLKNLFVLVGKAKPAVVFIPVRPVELSLVTSSSAVEGTSKVTLATCSTSGFRPATTFSLVWNFGNVNQTYTEVLIQDNITETFSVSSQYQRVVNRSDNGKHLSCSVRHATLSSPQEIATSVNIRC